MGGKGSGSRTKWRLLPIDQLPDGLSRVELEPVLAALVERDTDESRLAAESIRAELAARVWQNVNPYAVG